MDWKRLLGGFSFARTHYAADNRARNVDQLSEKLMSRHFGPNNSLWRNPVDAANKTNVRSRISKPSIRVLISSGVSTFGAALRFAP